METHIHLPMAHLYCRELCSYVWDYGDGSATTSGTNGSKTYATEGIYQVKLKSITPAVREAFGIKKGKDLKNLKNTYIGLADIIKNAADYTDKYVTEETHPDLVDKDRFERALYFLNSPGKVRKSDTQNYNESLDDASYLSRLTEEGREKNVGRANKTKLSMDPGSYPAKVLERAKELKTKINYEDPSVLGEVLVASKKKENGGLILKKKTKDNYGKKPNVNDAKVSAGPGFEGDGYTTQNWRSPAWGGQFQYGGSIPTDKKSQQFYNTLKDYYSASDRTEAEKAQYAAFQRLNEAHGYAPVAVKNKTIAGKRSMINPFSGRLNIVAEADPEVGEIKSTPQKLMDQYIDFKNL